MFGARVLCLPMNITFSNVLYEELNLNCVKKVKNCKQHIDGEQFTS